MAWRQVHAVLGSRCHRRDHAILQHTHAGMLGAGVDLAGQGQRPLRRAGLAGSQGAFRAFEVVAVAIEHAQGQGRAHFQRATGGDRAGVLPLRGRGDAATVFKAHIHAGVERFGRIGALPGVVDHVLAAALRQRALQLVGAIGRQRRVAQCAELLQVGPAQRAARLPAVAGDEEAPVTRGVRRGRLEHEGELAVGIGLDRRGLPVAAVQIQAAEGRVVAAAQLAVGDHGLVVAVGVGLVDAVPVVERLRTAHCLCGGAGRVGRVLRVALEAGIDAADRRGHGAVGGRGAGQGQACSSE
ncbi:hypothetical protein G6F31_010809 [Rhizopus arrhizus]|nr:hypothetical protein G6F31_010809 [Rhizopus arrhizus]